MKMSDNTIIKVQQINYVGITEDTILQSNYQFKLNLIIIIYRKINDFMQFCTNCQKSLPEDRFDLHLGYCRRNIKRCVQCNIPYDINNLQQHNEQFHNFQNCQYCSSKIISREIAQHKKNCLAKPIQCTYCQMSIPTDKYQDHKQQCQARTQTCEKCQKPVVNRQYFDHIGKCAGKVPISTPSHSSSNSNTYYANTSYSQPVTYISSQNGANTSSTSYYQSGTSSNTVYSPTYSSEQRPNVIRTYTRTYVPGQNQSGSASVSYSGPSTSVPTTTTTYTTNSNSGTTSYSSSNPVRRVISTRVIASDGTVIRQINNNSSHSPSPATYTTTYYRAPSTNPTTGQTGITYSYPSYSPTSNLSQGSSYDEDPQLQAALLASLGYQDQNSPALYSEVQRQHELQKQFNKK